MANSERKVNLLHRGRLSQIPIYLGKLLRGFVYMNDWKMLPMSAVIAALVCMVVRKSYFLSMDGTLKGSFAFCCVGIWNGCFNSIQVICRERAIIKREHRSGMHISSYIIAHMIYQALLCAAQTIVMIYVSAMCGIHFPREGFITASFKLDIGITLFLIAYASDMLSLLISAIAHSTTAAMTVMPFLLIFQLVFSGGFWALPSWAENFTAVSISNYGLKCLNAQADYNDLPMATAWNSLVKMENDDISGTVTIGEILDLIDDENGPLKQVRDIVIPKVSATEDTDETDIDALTAETVTEAPAEVLQETLQTNSVESAEPEVSAAPAVTEAPTEETAAETPVTVGDVLDLVRSSGITDEYRDVEIPYSFKLKDIIDYVGRDQLKEDIQTRTAKTMANSDYDHTKDNIVMYWSIISGFALLFALLAMILLEFIDKDKR